MSKRYNLRITSRSGSASSRSRASKCFFFCKAESNRFFNASFSHSDSHAVRSEPDEEGALPLLVGIHFVAATQSRLPLIAARSPAIAGSMSPFPLALPIASPSPATASSFRFRISYALASPPCASACTTRASGQYDAAPFSRACSRLHKTLRITQGFRTAFILQPEESRVPTWSYK